MRKIETDICVIGGGSGGLSVAAGASQMGADVVLFERAEMGGDCLNTGCVPSKALLASAKAAYALGGKPAMGIKASPSDNAISVDFAAVKGHVDDVIASIAPHDSVERFEGLGVQVFEAEARLSGRREVSAVLDDGTELSVTARFIVLATGSHPWAPPIPGLDEVPSFTNETIFGLREAPRHLVIIGAGPIGVEMAQAHRRLGCEVSVVDVGPMMVRDDPVLVSRLKQRLVDEGILIKENAQIRQVEQAGGDILVHLTDDVTLTASHILVAVGRRANVDGLNLEAAGVEYSAKGVVTDRRLRSSNPRIFAIGDVAGRQQFTHIASYHAGIVIRNMLFRLPARLSDHAVPWVTYTDPELAQAGMSWPDAVKWHGADNLRCIDWELADNDRARAERRTEGMVRVITNKKGIVLGATILAPHAGEMIHIWTHAIQHRQKIGAVATTIAPYPSYAEASKRAAGAYFTDKLFSRSVRRLVGALMRLSPR